MKKIYFIISVLCCFILNAQNLVLNGSFENHIACPVSSSQASLVTSWNSPLNNDADYMHVCSTNPGLSVPHAGSGYQQARTGDGFVGIYTYNGINNNYREYIRTMLPTQLISNEYYIVTFFCSSMGVLTYGTNNISLNLSISAINNTGTGNILNLPSNIYKYMNPIISDSLNWTKIVGIYKATGGEQYITIGNFENDNNTDTINTGNVNYPGAYYYIEDVSVENITTPQWQYRDTTITLGDSVLIGPAITGLNVDWFTMSNAFIKNAPGIYVKPTATTKYKATENFNSIVYNHTVTVTVLPPNAVNEYEALQNSVSVFPNPGSGHFSISLAGLMEGEIEITITDVSGKLVLTNKLSVVNALTLFDLDAKSGIYFVKITNRDKIIVKKLVVQQ